MPNTKSAIKRTRSTERKQQVNRAVKEGNKDGATSALKDVSSAYDKAAKKGVIHRNKADNKKSRLSKLAKTLS